MNESAYPVRHARDFSFIGAGDHTMGPVPPGWCMVVDMVSVFFHAALLAGEIILQENAGGFSFEDSQPNANSDAAQSFPGPFYFTPGQAFNLHVVAGVWDARVCYSMWPWYNTVDV